jgi:hypothetical protein
VRGRDPIWISLKDATPPSRRTVDEAIFVRAPALLRALVRLALKLPRGSRLRQALVCRSVVQAQGAWMRRDFEAGLIRFAPGYVLTVGEGDRLRLDFEASYRGRDGLLTFIGTYQDAFGDSPSYDPQWIVDLGDEVFVLLVHHSLQGRVSGASVEQMIAHRFEVRDGLVEREELHTAPRHDWESLAQTVGLDPAELPRRQDVTDHGAGRQATTR